jgi:hypothetical protein
MLNEHDIKDWVMLTEPLKLNQLKEGDLFSVLGDNKILKLLQVLNNVVFAEVKDYATEEIRKVFILPNFMGVYPWVINKNENQSSTNNC